MEIGRADNDFFDSQEEDFYYHDYNDDDEEEQEVWEDGEEVHLEVPPELLHALDHKRKKQMRMQCRPSTRYDAAALASVASLFSSPPRSPLHPFLGFFQHTTATNIAESWNIGCMDLTHTSMSFALPYNVTTTLGREAQATMLKAGTGVTELESGRDQARLSMVSSKAGKGLTTATLASHIGN